MNNKFSLIKVGETEDKRDIMSNVFKLYDTVGIPLIDIMQLMQKNNLIISWLHFYKEAIESGWKHNTIINKIDEAASEFYNPLDMEVFKLRLDLINVEGNVQKYFELSHLMNKNN